MDYPFTFYLTLPRPSPALPAGQLPTVGGARPGPSQKADRARPGNPHGCDGARRNSCTDRSSPAWHSRPVSRLPWRVPGWVRHRRPTGLGPAPPHSYDGAWHNSCTLCNFCSKEHPLREVINNHFSESFSRPLPMTPHFTSSRIFILHMGLWPTIYFMGNFSKTIN